MPTASSDIGTLVLCLWATWFGGLLLIASGLNILKTGRYVWTRTAPKNRFYYRASSFGPRLPKSAFQVTTERGPRAQQRGRNMVIFGIGMLIIFAALSVSFWTTAQDGSTQVLMVMGMVLALPVIGYLVTTRGSGQYQG